MMILVYLLLMMFPASINAEWTNLPFDFAMRSYEFPQAYELTKKNVGIDGALLYNFFKDLYERNSSLRIASPSDSKIPKIIHQIWLGSPVPESLQELQKTWIDHHTDNGWTYILWTDDNTDNMQLYNRWFYDATENHASKSDLLRYEILYNYGGIYVDMDFECLQSLDDLLCYDFFAGLEPLSHGPVQAGNALIASRPGHPILKHCMETVQDDWLLYGIVNQTGPTHFTRSFYAAGNQDGNRDIAFPSFYFYPIDCYEIRNTSRGWTQPGVFGIHWWAGSWMPITYRAPMFKDVNKDLYWDVVWPE